MRIEGREIGYGITPYIVCEIGAAHNGSMERAIRLVEIARKHGADAVKFQCYTPDTITIDSSEDAFIIKGGLWDGRRLYHLYKEAHTPRGWFPTLFRVAEELGITAFASVFSREDVDFMESLACPAYKISSFEIVDLPLINYAASTGKPIIFSTGMASRPEMRLARLEAMAAGVHFHDIIKLHCVSAYPMQTADSRLYDMENGDGLSDHSIGPDVAIAAAARGASIIEKHLTLSRNGGGPDDGFASEPDEFAYMVKVVRNINKSVFQDDSTLRTDAALKPYRRSLYVVEDMKAGDAFTSNNIRSIRPGGGDEPSSINAYFGQFASADIKAGTPLKKELMS